MRYALIGLLSFGVVAGYGSAIARAAYWSHGGGCHGSEGRGSEGRWGGHGARFDPRYDDARFDPRAAAPVAAPQPQTVVVQSPAPAAAPAPQIFVIMPGATSPVAVPQVVVPAQAVAGSTP